MDAEKPLVNKKLLLERFDGKGGWTYILIKGIPKDKIGKAGKIRVKGSIDGAEISKYILMPWTDGNHFLPVRASIRKQIKKQGGDYAHVLLYPDNAPLEIPEELSLCLQEEPSALAFFNTLSESEQRLYIVWICSAKKEDTRVDRIAKSINRLVRKLKLYQPEK